MKELHPHLSSQNIKDFVLMINEMIINNQYQLGYIKKEIEQCCDNNQSSIHHNQHDDNVPPTSILSTSNTTGNVATDVTTVVVVVVAVIGFRYQHNLSHGKHIYIDDLSTLSLYQGNGYGTMLLDYVTRLSTNQDIKMIALDSGYHRNNAHRLYIKYGFILQAHHFIKRI